MNGYFLSAGLRLSSYLKVPAEASADRPGMILCHGFPVGPLDARKSAGTYPELVDRVVYETDYAALTFNFRGTGDSQGDFSLQSWVEDLREAIEYIVDEAGVSRVVIVGTSTGGSVGICVAADDHRVSACALLSPRADFDDWADHPRRFLDHARSIGAVRTPGFPVSMDDWARAFRRFRPLSAAQRFAPRPLLVMHGDEDDSVPVADSRQLAHAHGHAELSILPGAGHRLRHDPRAIAILLGWLNRVR